MYLSLTNKKIYFFVKDIKDWDSAAFISYLFHDRGIGSSFGEFLVMKKGLFDHFLVALVEHDLMFLKKTAD